MTDKPPSPHAARHRAIAFIFWALIAAAIIWIAVSCIWRIAALNTQGQAQGERHTAHYAERAREEIQERCRSPHPAIQGQCIEEVITAAHENKRDESDLQAQWQMANWAYAMVVISGFSFFATIAGIYFVRENLEEMRLQRDLTQRSVDIAADTERPFMILSKLSVSGVQSEPGIDGSVTVLVEFRFRNYGRSPAILDSWTMTVTVDENLPEVPSYGPYMYTRIVNAVNEEFGSTKPLPCFLEASSICRLLMGEYELYVSGIITYTSLTRRSHKTRFAQRINFDGGDASTGHHPVGPDAYWETS